MSITGVVLAGGAGRRMGQDKAAVEIAGKPLLEIVIAALGSVADQLIVAGRHDALDGVEAVPDPDGPAYRGPLAGLVAGLKAANNPIALVVAVDQPWVRPQTLVGLSQRYRELPVVPIVDGVRQTTCAAYPASLAPLAEAELTGGGSIQSLLDRSAFDPVIPEEWERWGEDGRSWYSVDTPTALEIGLTRYGPPGTTQPPM